MTRRWAYAEAVAWWRRLAHLDLDDHTDTYLGERARLAGRYAKHGRPPEATLIAEDEAAHQLGFLPSQSG